jgi:hypothetical protein
VPNRRRSKEIRTGEVAQDNFLRPCVVSPSPIWLFSLSLLEYLSGRIAVLVIGEAEANAYAFMYKTGLTDTRCHLQLWDLKRNHRREAKEGGCRTNVNAEGFDACYIRIKCFDASG